MKKTQTLQFSFFLAGFIFLFFSCKPDESEYIDEAQAFYESTAIYTDDEYATITEYLDLPNLGFPSRNDYFDFKLPHQNDITHINTMKATLGKVLFYDKDLSIDGSTSCASCHKQELAFADDTVFSVGANGNHTDRNAIAIGSFVSIKDEYGTVSSHPSLTIVRNKLFWDERAEDFRDQMDQTFLNPKEMGIDMTTLTEVVNAKPYYNILTQKAFATENITHLSIKDALSEFMSAFHSSNAPFDIALDEMGPGAFLSTDFDRFSISENLGKKLFRQNCSTCHGSSVMPNSFSNNPKSANNGLDAVYTDQGIGHISSNDFDNGKFKVPSLRNIAVSGPYMHDGRFETLEEVVDFYNDGIQAHPNLHPSLKQNDNPIKLNLTDTEKQALIDFLNTLTDENFLSDPKFADPFKF